MSDYMAYCTDCKTQTEVVDDHTSGDTICTDCGLVLDHHFIDQTCEWRTFADSEKDDHDPNRVGNVSNPLLSHGNLSTTIVAKPGQKLADEFNRKNHDSLTNPDKVLTEGFESISRMAERLSIGKSSRIRADEIYKNLLDKKSCKGKNVKSILAACLFVACKESKMPRTAKEICSVAQGVSRKEINRAADFIKKHTEIDVIATAGCLNGSGLVRRFCSNLGMKNQDMKAVQEALENSKEVDIRRSPCSILAAIIFIIAQLSGQKIAIRDIAMASQVAEQTIKKSYKDIRPHASRVVPRWYAKECDLNKLCKA
ncbi:transcription initiation factor IIB-like [Mercurialis annua]|uniref:transcription initiation factor IIB-like n=1 Tax=Mercurialis annua TaxID=3986 RepID=UPI00215DDDC6|nr:transcription initiation factor IIB-like [Mercurialis annua]